MNLNEALAKALKQIRQTKGLTQEDFSFVSSRTYISTLERGLKSPTIEKLEQISGVMGIHPLTVLAIAYMEKEECKDIETLFEVIKKEVNDIMI